MKNSTHIALLGIAALTLQSCFSTRSDTRSSQGTATFGANAPATGNRTSRSPGNTFSSDGNGTAVSATSGARTVTEAAGAMGTANTTGDAGNESSAVSSSSEEAARFIQRATVSGLSEVSLSELALKNAQSSAVKEFAAMMVKDHGAANTDLKALAQTKKITIQNGGEIKPEQLSTSSPEKFDQNYVKLMIKNHASAVSLFENGSRLSDPQVKAYAIKYLPALKMHLQQAKALGKTIK